MYTNHFSRKTELAQEDTNIATPDYESDISTDDDDSDNASLIGHTDDDTDDNDSDSVDQTSDSNDNSEEEEDESENSDVDDDHSDENDTDGDGSEDNGSEDDVPDDESSCDAEANDDDSEHEDKQDEESDNEVEPSNQRAESDNYEGWDVGDAGYVGFHEWKNNYIARGKRRWGVGQCWDFCKFGYCDDPNCKFEHSKVKITPKLSGKRSTMIMPFGEHRGKLLHDLPQRYAKWMAKKGTFMKPDRYPRFVSEMKRLFPGVFN